MLLRIYVSPFSRKLAQHTFPVTGLNCDIEPVLGSLTGLVFKMWCLERV